MAAETAEQLGQSQTTEAPKMSDELFGRFVELIYTISGIRFTQTKAYFLTSKLELRRKALALKTLEDYYRFLQQPHAKATEYPNLLSEVTINETFFYRNQPQLEAFEKDILMPLINEKRRKNDLRLRIWSAASSTGDEAYTTAMQLLAGSYAKDFRIEIIGTDISRRAIEGARTAIYGSYATRNVPAPLLNRFFRELPDGQHEIRQEVKSLVTFKEGNLQDTMQTKLLGTFDIIFCRNVLIYFDDASKRKVLENLASAMTPDSFLLIGHSENLYPYRDIFRQDLEKVRALAYKLAPRKKTLEELGIADLVAAKKD
ncbi:MAG: protein-glutamate O-methyltransferase CheR [Proteobacteria bacterium]|nr:protein-glutamate O-methyltransferase CheR [Pseudomonadota bacterium]